MLFFFAYKSLPQSTGCSISQVIFSDNQTGGITGQNNVNSALASALLSRQWWDMKHKDSTGSYVANPELDNSVSPFYNNQFREYSAKNTWNFIEWPQKIEDFLPKNAHKIEILLICTGFSFSQN